VTVGRTRLATALALVATAGCGYHLSGTGVGVLPSSIRTIAVEPFANRTERPEIEQRLTEALTREMARRARYKVVADASAADAVLEGAVTSYRTPPVEFTSAGRQSRVEATVTLEATLRERAGDAVLWSQRGLVFKQPFDVPDSGIYVDQESLALDLLARQAAETLVTSMLEGF
jgi:outer membrane lipopolysaccharide assembly protein LptE/RlpB